MSRAVSKIAIVGAGAIGGTVAAWLAQRTDLSVFLCVRTPVDRLEVETPLGWITAALPNSSDPDTVDSVDWVFVATKTYDAAGASLWLKRLIAPSTKVAVLQNGVEHVERFARYLPASQILPAVVDIPAERRAPARILQRRAGTIITPREPAGAEFVGFFAHTPIVASITEDFPSVAWGKLCINCAGAVSALILKPTRIANLAAIADIMRALVAECVAVGRAEGASLSADLPDIVVDQYRKAPPDGINSMHADRIAGRPLELDARNGVIVRLGRKHNIPTPMNEIIVALLEAAAGP